MTEQIMESRGDRRSYQRSNRESKENVQLPFVTPLIWSFLLAFFSVANPFLTQLATNLQEQILYGGWALQQGQMVYENFYGTAGILFYLLIWLGSFYQGAALLSLFQFVFFYISGRKAYRFAYNLTGNQQVAGASTHFFYFLTLILGFGGLYAPLFTLPLLLVALETLLQISQGEVGNKIFLRYGALASIVVMIDPFVGTFFFGINFLYLTYHNLRQRQIGVGVSQLLSGLIGFSLVFYPLGYVTVFNGTFGLALNQGSYIWQTMNFHMASFWQPALFYFLVLLGLGLPIGLWGLRQAPRTREGLFFLPLGVLGSLATWLVASSQAEFGFHQLLPGLVYFWLIQIFLFDRLQAGVQHGRHKKAQTERPLFRKYVATLFYLPLLLGTVLVLLPLGIRTIGEAEVQEERQELRSYIQAEADRSDTLYAWDSRANWYQEVEMWSASSLLSPDYYLALPENQIRLTNDLEGGRPRYVVVNQSQPLLDEVERELSTNYSEIETDLNQFKLYERK
ncbi:hypothetical protein JEQ21_01265 [Streptococcus sp. 121]|uniref:hypothetical protein n=1 Tax=Streptococcus sp. 121 TaxID=2797637 RepID=UPI0018F0AD53|nr:hypothetical protein [Streptococcus sp. 121]MBJ6745098.1 hypothetical protein [Streptococcus sp. 121]